MPTQTQLKPMLQQQIKMMKSLIYWKTKDCSSKLAAKLRYPLNSFDCSGFVRSVFKDAVGFVLPRSSVEQANATQRIDKDDLKAGDLVFFNTMKRAFSHVGVYLGDGKFIHSPRAGGQVRVEDMRIPYWNVRFDGARRVQTAGLPSASIFPIGTTTNSVFVHTIRLRTALLGSF